MTDPTLPTPPALPVGVPIVPAPAAIDIPATPVSPEVTASDIPTVTLPLTTAAKAHLGATIAAVAGAGETIAQFLPDGQEKTYIVAGVAVVTVIAIWLGVYVAPNLPKITILGKHQA